MTICAQIRDQCGGEWLKKYERKDSNDVVDWVRYFRIAYVVEGQFHWKSQGSGNIPQCVNFLIFIDKKNYKYLNEGVYNIVLA